VKLRAVQIALVIIVQFSLAVLTQNCTAPPAPSEVNKALAQDQDLWRAGAPFFAADEYENYRNMLVQARKVYEKEELKVGYFRNYELVKKEFAVVIREGERIQSLIEIRKETLSGEILKEKTDLYSRYETLDNLSLEINQRGLSRKNLAQVDVMFKEAERLMKRAKYEEARAKLKAAGSLLNQAELILKKQLERYMDLQQIAYWRKLAQQAIEKSRETGETAILVSKLEKKLTLYKAGLRVQVYNIGLGFNGLSDKLHAGDDATPEGEYTVIRKVSPSSFGKALLINYPNEQDIRKFNEAKKRGYITASTRIGGLIEIHGGGKDGLTKGCIALDDREMEDLFRRIPVGTQVTIVGTTDPNNKIISMLKKENR